MITLSFPQVMLFFLFFSCVSEPFAFPATDASRSCINVYSTHRRAQFCFLSDFLLSPLCNHILATKSAGLERMVRKREQG